MELGSSKKSPTKGRKDELYHIIHKVPSGDTPYVRAKHAQLVEKDPEAAIVWFWKALNAGDRVDSALKDMAVKSNYMMAEVVYWKAQMIDPDSNKACNFSLSLIRQGRYDDARVVLEEILQSRIPGSEDSKSLKRARELLMDLKSNQPSMDSLDLLGLDDDFVKGDSESRSVLDAFFLGKAPAEALNERVESAVGELLGTVGRLQSDSEQQKQVLDFQGPYHCFLRFLEAGGAAYVRTQRVVGNFRSDTNGLLGFTGRRRGRLLL
ncbi:hypothetical protein FNV43_RR23097 [Rhamnella rubrinervis]|uniref:Tetratricopeptide repeat protein n=1 Tax=Rhamnella rubrinervis TaxID=2594499 RepID=A0A8K0DYA6_9ROSA|nr:hypothetical protein FNV43_RR23097 [Rhamnella rubrinervis]